MPIFIQKIGRNLYLMEHIRGHQHYHTPRLRAIHRPHFPEHRESAGILKRRVVAHRDKFRPEVKRLILELSGVHPQGNIPFPHHALRNQLKLMFEHLENLLLELSLVHILQRALLHPVLKNLFHRLGQINRRLLGRSSGDKHLVFQYEFLIFIEFVTPVFQQPVNDQARSPQQHRVQNQNAQPFSHPDFPARYRLHHHELDSAILNIPRQNPAGKPQRRQSQRRYRQPHRIGQEYLHKTARRAVILDKQRQRRHRHQQEQGKQSDNPEAKCSFEGQFRNR